ncbi:lanthionine synthetase C family protein [Actinomadura madurae]|uniref:lanthionine synthetase C family protein n=1 Tax=Actinomadura madurae TaxID=1993 RepID=UPI0020262EC0|nr:lanthionine synthetase C family protein [Actinomadura madurae]MCQ0008202.1 lanthionine synthetase C family protein [Actinomadura madurae]URN07269.1 lanthionine synthetase C family protein [Actinomadura madurae]
MADRLTAAPADDGWENLGSGDLGIALALLHASEVLDDERYLRAGQAVLRRAVEATARDPLVSAGLFTGTAGFVWVLAEFARRDPRYGRSLRSVTGRLAERTPGPPERGGVALGEFDVINGAAGRLAAVLKAAETVGAASGSALRDAADGLAAYLLEVTAVDADGAPNWFCPPRLYPKAAPWFHDQFPHGMYNLGFSHGLPGMLAALTLAARAGIRRRQAEERVAELVDLLAEWRWDDGAGPTWPGALRAAPESRLPVRTEDDAPARTAWCYGAPGVAAALLSAATISGDTSLAVAALTRVRDAPESERRTFAPTLCHGVAGLLAVCTRAYAQTGDPVLQEMRDDTRSRLCAMASDEHPFVFADMPEPDRPSHTTGLLEGAAGVLLALLGTVSPEASRWDEVLFLTPTATSAA